MATHPPTHQQERAPAERLINLVVTLESSPGPRTFAQLRNDTKAYLQDDPQSARRMFERDKEALRELGVPIQTVESPEAGLPAYTVDRSEWRLPRGIHFDREEATALAVAMAVAGSQRERLALSRLLARAPDPDEVSLPPVRLALGEGAGVDTVAEAVTRHRTVEFSYRGLSGHEEQRRVDPWAVGVRNGTAYLVGYDHRRTDRRTFRLSRLTSPVRVVGEPGSFDPPSDLDVEAALSAQLGDGVDVEVAVAPIAVAELEQHGGHVVDEPASRDDDGARWRRGRIPDADPARLRGWLLAAADRVVVVSPPELRDEVVTTLSALAGEDPQ